MNRPPEDKQILLLSHLPTLLGISVIFMGCYFLFSGVVSMSRNETLPPAPAATTTPPPQSATTLYRLVFDPSGAWKLTAGGGPVVLYLPPLFPEPAIYTPPARPLTGKEIADSLVKSLEAAGFTLSDTDYQTLSELQLENKPLFNDTTRLRARLAGGSPVPTAIIPSTPNNPDQTPARVVDPNSDAFLDELTAWRDQIFTQLEQAKGRSRGHRLTFPSAAGTTRLFVSGKARKRILAPDFGTQQGDRDIYRQVLVCIHVKPILVDGMIGPASRQAFAQLNQKMAR